MSSQLNLLIDEIAAGNPVPADARHDCPRAPEGEGVIAIDAGVPCPFCGDVEPDRARTVIQLTELPGESWEDIFTCP